MRKLLAYADQISLEPGQTINFKVSSELTGRFRLELVRVRCGDDSPNGPGLKQRRIEAAVNGEYPARHQNTQVGSFIRIDERGPFELDSFTLQAMIRPTTPRQGRQAIMGAWNEPKRAGYALIIDDR